jgi:FMN phosphatase YigB (HAD superfamily)
MQVAVSAAPRLRTAPAAPPVPRLLHSFDVFDTLITRCLWRPEDLFLLLGHRLGRAGLLRGTPEEFARLRRQAEARLRREPGTEEVQLAAIHSALAASCGWTPGEARRAAALELATEEAAIRPVAANAARLARLRDDGAEVALVSDTYLDRASLLRLLQGAGIGVPPPLVFASAAHGVTKRTGRLFGVVAAAACLAPERILHRGDHPEADVAVPRLMGIRAEHCATGAPTRHETTLHAATAAHPPLLRSLLAGGARAARLSADPPDSHRRVLWEVGTGVAGPLLTGFVLWILHQARAAGVARLHFVARDGQILLRIAEILLARLGWPIECRYLMGSRQAWHLPALAEIDETALAWLVANAHSDPLGGVLARAELAPGQIATALARHGLGRLDRPAPAAQLRALLLDAEVAPLIHARAALRRHSALGYLRQEKVLEGRSATIIDLGWHGRLQHSLQKLADLGAGEAGATQVSGFYFALRGRPQGIPAERMRSYVEAPQAVRRLNPVLLEMFCAADHGTVRRYREAPGGGYEAELATARDKAVLDWGLEALQGGILAFARECAAAMELGAEAGAGTQAGTGAWIALLRDGGMAGYQRFRTEPDAAEAEAFGTFPHADGQAHLTTGDCAPRVGALMRLRLGLGLRAAGYGGHWPEASLRRGGGRVENALFALKRLRRRVG